MPTPAQRSPLSSPSAVRGHEPDAPAGEALAEPSGTTRVERNARGGWNVLLPGHRTPVRCETVDDALRLARVSAADGEARKLIVRDAYHRLLDRRLLHRPHGA